MRTVFFKGALLLAVVGTWLAGSKVFADVACAEFEIWTDIDGAGFYYAAMCDGEPSGCVILDYVGMDVYPAYEPEALPRVCNRNAPPSQCEYMVGTGATRTPRTQNIAQSTPAQPVQQVVYYWCGRRRCCCYTVCAAAAPASSAAPTPATSRIEPSRSPHVCKNIRLKAAREESYTPRKNQKSPFAENINIGFPTYFSFASLRKPGTMIYAKGFVVTTQKFQWNSKTYRGLTLTNGFEVKKGSETYPLISAENVTIAGNTTSSYIVKVSGVDYLVHTTE